MSFPVELPLRTNSNTQTDTSMVTHTPDIDEVASVVAEVGMQTTISCLPAASVITILPQLIHEKQNILLEINEETWHCNQVKNIVGFIMEDESNIKQLLYETGDDTSDTDEFEETTDELPDLLDSKINNNTNMEIQKETDQYSFGQVKEINNNFALPSSFEMSFDDVIQHDDSNKHGIINIKEHEPKGDTIKVHELKVSHEIYLNEPPVPDEFENQEVNEPSKSEMLDETNESKEPDESNENNDSNQVEKNNDDSDQNEESNDESDPNQNGSDELESNENEETSLKQNNCPCGSNALKKIADQLRNQSITIQLTPELLPSGINYEERVIEALNVTMSALQVEMAKLMDAFSDNQNIASTSCNCADSPVNASDAVKIIVDEQRNTLQIKINKYTEIDELHVTRNPPGDHIEQNAVHVECECHPSHAGAAPPYSFTEHYETCSSSKKIKPRSPIVPHYTTPANKSCCNKPSCSNSRIPTPVLQNRYSSVRTKRSENDTNQCKIYDKTSSKSKNTGSAGVQTKLALGNRLHSESLNSIDDESYKTPWNNISLPAPGTYSIKSLRKSNINLETSSHHIPNLQRCRSCGLHSELPWRDILIPVANTTARSQPSCSCRNPLNTNKEEVLESSTPFIAIKIKSPNVAQSQSCTDTRISHHMNPKSTSSVPEILNDTKALISIKIVGQEDKEIIKEIALEPGANMMIVNLEDIKAETEKQNMPLEETDQPQDAEQLVLDNEDAKNGDNIEDTEKNNNENNKENQKDSDSLFAPAECACKDNVEFNTFKPDPVMLAMETCEAEMKPLRQALQELQMKVRNLNIPELKGCSCTLALEEHSKCVSTLNTGRPDPQIFHTSRTLLH
ncbi:hypothetical protein FQR65_LT04062 [Abscondita terminalis]|nr:hypothetical protein FQR65_LT04062 [Abscondita terminalis]